MNVRSRQFLSILILISILLIVVRSLSTIVSSWNMLYDDAFISYTYARNLANGYGLVWNVGEEPTEGYTNLLFILFLTPFMFFGMDALSVARLLSLISVVAIATLLYFKGIREYKMTPAVALLAPVVFVLIPSTTSLILVGLETLVYSLALLASLIVGIDFVRKGKISSSIIFVLVAFATSLLRPEALMLVPIVWIGAIVHLRQWPRKLISLGVGVIVFAVLIASLLVWKSIYFGSVLPNPFYLKSSQVFLSELGVASVLLFASSATVLIGLMIFSFIPPGSGYTRKIALQQFSYDRISRNLGISFVLLNILFFLRTDTLADMQGRFLFPLLPIILYLSLPVFKRIGSLLEHGYHKARIASTLGLFMVLILASGTGIERIGFDFSVTRYLNAQAEMQSQLQSNRQLEIARTMAEFPQIKNVKVAYGDAGLIPYLSEAKWLDPVGLNDSFLAKSTSLGESVDYFFEQSPDVVFLPMERGASLITYGHGILGNYQAWASDSRWDGFEYVGTILREDAPYDLLVMVNRESDKATSLATFLTVRLTNGKFDVNPVSLGSAALVDSGKNEWQPNSHKM